VGEQEKHNEREASIRWPSVCNLLYAALLSELSEVLATCHLQLTRGGSKKTVQLELKRLSRALATSARDFRPFGDE